MFKPTKEEINDALQRNPEFKHGEEVHFLIKEIKTTEKDGNETIIVVCDLLNTEHKGREFKHFCRLSNKPGKAMAIAIMSAFYKEEEILAGIQPQQMIGLKMKSDAKVTAKEGKTYINFFTFEQLGDVPDMGGSSDTGVGQADIPF